MEIDIDRELDTVEQRVERTRAEAQRRAAEVGPIRGRAASDDGAIGVEVGPGGLLTEVRLAPAALNSGAEVLAGRIMALAEQATRRAGGAMYEALAPVLGPSGEKHLASLGYEPLEEDDDEEEGVFDRPIGVRPERRPRR